MGSLYTALAGFLDARAHQGRWLLRIDDLDTPRNVKGADTDILKTLELFGLYWDGSAAYQSQHISAYQDFLTRLKCTQRIYACACSRKTLATAALQSAVYPGFCRDRSLPLSKDYAWRIKTEAESIRFNDRLQGSISHNLATRDGDFIIKRKDHIIAYQFAVVIDDYLQQINHVVRGHDLLDSTPKQVYIHQQLSLPAPDYMHVPVIMGPNGLKLSKQTLAQAVSCNNRSQTLFQVLELLKQTPPQDLKSASINDILTWAIQHWRAESLTDIQYINATEA